MKLLPHIRQVVATFPEVRTYLSGRSRWSLYKPTEYKTVEYMENAIEGLVNGVYNGNIGGQFIDTMANIISGQLTQAYRQAWEDEGMTDYFAPDYLSESLEAMILNQYDYVDQFYRDIVDARVDGTSVSPLLARAKLWANQWNAAYNEAVRLITLQGGGNLVWEEGDTMDKCGVCVGLDGLVMSAREWELLGMKPQSESLPCHGFNCHCSLTPTDKRRSPNAYGRAEEIILINH